MALLLSLRGSVSVYQGEELGLTEAELALADLRDPFGIAYFPEFRGRDGSRTPMPWDGDAPHAGFTTGTPWLPVPQVHLALAADRSRLLGDWQRFLHWRRGCPAMRLGRQIPLDLPAPLVGFVRAHEGTRILALFNLAEAPAAADLGTFPGLRPLPQTGFAPTIDGETAVLPAFGALFAELETELVPELAPAGWSG